jgi:serine/threonine protein phosphatase PrpC
VREWSAAVDEHVAQFPFTEEEWTHLSTQLGSRAAQARASIEANPRIAYGTTMLAAAITHRHLLAVQLGDGDIVLVTEDGAVSRAIERDPVLIANETHSLCQDAAWRWFRTFFLPFWNAPPALVLLSTDGYANSFREDAGFLQIGTDLLSMLRQSGPDAVHEVMASWLAEASRSGSGDDVTLGVMCRLDALAIAPEPASNETEPDSPDVGALHDASATAVMAGEPTASERPDNDLSETPHA